MSGLRLVLVRHGITDWNLEGRFQGHLDPPLADSGRHEAELVAERLATDDRLRPARIVSSSLGRALQTAETIGTAVGAPVAAEPRLIEIGQGEWEGRTHAEIEQTDTDRYRAWREAAGVRQPPGGEPVAAAAARIEEALTDLAISNASPLCVVSHGGSLRILARVLLELPVERPWALDVDNASISVVSRAGRDAPWSLERWNDTRHLLGLEPTHVDESDGRPLAL